MPVGFLSGEPPALRGTREYSAATAFAQCISKQEHGITALAGRCDKRTAVRRAAASMAATPAIWPARLRERPIQSLAKYRGGLPGNEALAARPRRAPQDHCPNEVWLVLLRVGGQHSGHRQDKSQSQPQEIRVNHREHTRSFRQCWLVSLSDAWSDVAASIHRRASLRYCSRRPASTVNSAA
jgi:hypothetical protein